jgi:hypothetical protein
MMTRLLPFPTALARYRQWRDAFLGVRLPESPARVIGIDYLRWKRYGSWRRQQMALKKSRYA